MMNEVVGSGCEALTPALLSDSVLVLFAARLASSRRPSWTKDVLVPCCDAFLPIAPRLQREGPDRWPEPGPANPFALLADSSRKIPAAALNVCSSGEESENHTGRLTTANCRLFSEFYSIARMGERWHIKIAPTARLPRGIATLCTFMHA